MADAPEDVAVVREIEQDTDGLTAVIGAHNATTRIPHGAQVEIDPRHGTVRVL